MESVIATLDICVILEILETQSLYFFVIKDIEAIRHC